MHLGNGAITPECAALGFAAAGLGVGASWLMVRKACQPHTLYQAAALGTVVFASQMINVPVLETSSVHLVGGVLLAALLNPALSVLVMSAVLLVQALLLGDGGTTALGVNIVNMALVPAGCVLLLKRMAMPQNLSLATGAVCSLVLASLLIGGEVALGRSSLQLHGWGDFVGAMLIAHLPALVMEALLTVLAVRAWRHVENREPARTSRFIAGAFAAALLMIAVASYISSELPDGYESAAQVSQMEWLLAEAK